ncbi:TPA: hypothetical protein ACHU7H_001514 [Streptococcus suis]|nr:hypothetical protein [Streptococcus suis]
MKSKRLEERASSTRKSRFPSFSCWCPSSCGSWPTTGITTAFSRYAIAVWDMDAGQVAGSLMLATIAAIITYIPSGFSGTKS